MKNSKELDDKLAQLFADKNVVIVGFSFNSDIEMFSRKFPNLKFYKYISNFIDA